MGCTSLWFAFQAVKGVMARLAISVLFELLAFNSSTSLLSNLAILRTMEPESKVTITRKLFDGTGARMTWCCSECMQRGRAAQC